MGLLSKAFTPLTNLPSQAAKKIASVLDAPTRGVEGYGALGEGVNKFNAMGRGFLSGATQGAGDLLSDMTSPASLAMMALGPMAGVLGRGARGVASAAKTAAPTIDLLEQLPVKQTMGTMEDVGSLIGDMQRNLARIPNAGARVANTPAAVNMPAEMVAMGQEAGFNAPRLSAMQRAAQNADDMAERAAQLSGKRRPFSNVPRQATPLRSAYPSR